jgi:mRNA-degrading endonuclease RelE of RelBE toxin-antitoxin system
VRRQPIVNPRDPRWARPLREPWRGYWRIYVGNLHRLIYEIEHPSRVLIAKIGPRATIYQID